MKKEIFIKSFFFLFIFNQILFSQIPIEGFCKLEEIKIPSNVNKIFPFDFNDDGYKDLIAFNPNQKGYFTITANKGNLFNSPVFHYSSNSLSEIKTESDIYLGKKVGALINNSKEISFLNFSKNGTIDFSNRVKLNGFASSIDISKNTFGKIELITAGAGLDGIKIYHQNKSKLNLYENIKGKIFSHLTYIDLNYDAFDDIAAFDITSNSLVFFYNNRFGDYDEQRSIGLNGLVNDIQVADVNSDRFSDLIINVDGKLNFFLGDSVSSFQKKSNLTFENEKVSSFFVFDFNGDGINDFAFVNDAKDELKISFGKGNNNFYKPITYLKKNNISQIVGYFDRGGRKLAAISGDGFIYIISKIFINDDEFKISLANNPVSFELFDYRNDGYKDICWVDLSSKLNIALSERKNLFSQLFQIELQSKNDKVKIDDSKPELKTFVTYKKNERSIEIIRFNFMLTKVDRKIIFSKNPIEDLNIFTDKFKDRFVINAITKSSNEIYFEKFEIIDFNLFDNEIMKISSNEITSTIGVYGGTKIASFIKQNDKYDFIISYLGNNSIKKVNRLSFKVSEKDNVNFSLIKVEQFFARANPFVALISINNKSALYIFSENKNYRFNINYKISNKSILNYIVNESTLDIYFISDKNKLIKLVFDEQFNLIATKEIKLANDLENYKIANFNSTNEYFIYSDDNLLAFKKSW